MGPLVPSLVPVRFLSPCLAGHLPAWAMNTRKARAPPRYQWDHSPLCLSAQLCLLSDSLDKARGAPGWPCPPGPVVSTIILSFPSQDLARLQEGQPPEHRDVALQKVSDSEKLLYVLEADAAIAKHMKHPQGDMIAEE